MSNKPLISAHIVPGTDYRFVIEFSDTHSIKLRSLETGKKATLVHGSPEFPSTMQAAFFLKYGPSYNLHFATLTRKKSKLLQTWHNWYIGPDFIETLNTHKELPLGHTVDSMMRTIHSRDTKK